MKAADFVSCPEDLLPAALVYGDKLSGAGWSVEVEPYDLAFPRTPVMIARRRTVTQFVEVQSSVDREVLEEWVRYAKSLNEDSRLVSVVAGEMPSAVDIAWAKELGVGLVLADPFIRICDHQDLALNIKLPTLPEELGELLGEAYDLFDKGEWREGFEAAATCAEQEAREYLKREVPRRAITFTGGKSYDDTRIAKLTLGQLAQAFAEIEKPNVADTRIGEGLGRINRDRVTAAHYKGQGGQRADELRRNVAQHMFVVVSVLRQIRGL